MAVNFTDNLIETLYYLLYAKYGNSSFNSTDLEQCKYKVFSTIFMYAPAWKMRLQIQEKIFNLDPDAADIKEGTIMYYNHAENPDTAPATDAFQTLQGINSQSTSNVKRGKLEGYATLNALINTDVTEDFLEQFRKLFIRVVSPQKAILYPEIGENAEAIIGGCPAPDFGAYTTMTFQEVWETAEDFKTDYQTCGIPTTI